MRIRSSAMSHRKEADAFVPGMMFTIEPMINEGSPDFFVDEDNGWTVYTMDDGLSAQIEYMVLVTGKRHRDPDKIKNLHTIQSFHMI